MLNVSFKRKLSSIIIVAIGITIATIFLCNLDTILPSNKTNEDCRVTFIDVGQGDSTLISCNGEHVLIDAGENNCADAVLLKLRKLNVTKLKYVIGTHAHVDHIGALDEVIRAVKVENVILYDIPSKLKGDAEGYDELLDAINDTGTNTIWAKARKEFNVGKGKLKILAPTKTPDSLNNASIISKFTFGESEFLFMGDAEENAELSLISSKADISADVLKVSHHGSSTSTCDKLLSKVKPEYAVIEVGLNNVHGHPSADVLQRLIKAKAEVHRTDLCGDITAVTDGCTIKFKCEK